MARILLVDDDVSFRSMLREVLRRAGHEVREAGNGGEALAAFVRESSDLVVTDLVMPDQEGIETIIALRKLHPDLKIIAMSGGGRMNPSLNLEMAKRLGAARTLAKPFSHAEILEAIDGVLKSAS
jgi:CheY-like chemotaxis protein